MLRSLLILLCLVASTAACIPMKHPDPGMPATPKPVTPKCPAYPESPPAECAPAKCNTDPPVITVDRISCPQRLCLYYNDAGTIRTLTCGGPVVCTDDGWRAVLSDGSLGTPIDVTGRDAPKWGCRV